MSNSQQYNEEATHKERKTRKTHSKVKTGCLTCKIRRKKCDETKPHCLRCTSTGRKCDGYITDLASESSVSYCSTKYSNLATPTDQRSNSNLTVPSRHDVTAIIRSTSTAPVSISRISSLISFSSDVDYCCFDYFRFKTGPQIQSYYDSSMWGNGVVREALLNPAILKVATAVGAVHQRFDYGISREAFEYCAVADRLYHEAVNEFRDFRRQNASALHFNDVCMLVSMLFGLFEAFQGNYDRAVKHTGFGLKVLWSNRPYVTTYSESRYREYRMEPSLLFDLFDKLRARATQLFGTSPGKFLSFSPANSVPSTSMKFHSLEEARDYIFTECETILYTPEITLQDDDTRQHAHRLHVSRILQWSVAYAEMLQDQTQQGQAQRKAGGLLRCIRDMSHLLLYLVFCARIDPTYGTPALSDFIHDIDLDDNPQHPNDPLLSSSTLWDLIRSRPDLSTKVTRVCMIIDSVVDPDSPFTYSSHSISMDSGIGPPRLPEPSPEGSAKTRHMVRTFLKRQKSRSGQEVTYWQAPGIYRIIERYGALEEHAVFAAAKDLIPQHTDLRWIDFTYLLEERKLLLRYCKPDGLGERSRGLIWVQEWIEF